MRRAKLYLALIALLLGPACNTTPGTQVLVEFRASAATIALATHMTVTVYDEAGAPVEPSDTRELGAGPGQVTFPTTVPIEPLGGDASRRFRIVGALRDAAGRMVARAELAEGFVAGERREVSVDFDPKCTPMRVELPPLPEGRQYFVGPLGDDSASGDTRNTPWATFAHALDMMIPGDVLIVLDGRYDQALHIRKSGMPGAPLTVVAESDGGATIDGSAVDTPCQIGGLPDAMLDTIHDVELRGFVCVNGAAYGAVHIEGVSDVTVRRVSARTDGMAAVFNVARAHNALFEDVVASGAARSLFGLASTTDTTLRRCFAYRTADDDAGYKNGVLLADGVERTTVENCIAMVEDPTPQMFGFSVQVAAGKPSANDNRLIGNIAREVGSWGFFVTTTTTPIRGTRVESSLSLRNSEAMTFRGDSEFVADANTLIGGSATVFENAYVVSVENAGTGATSVSGRFSNSVATSYATAFQISSAPEIELIERRYNDVFDIDTRTVGDTTEVGELSIDPGYDVARYGDGAYLMAPAALRGMGEDGVDVGATILYRLENGVTSDVPLWPWPMEDRIVRELGGLSLTFEPGGLFRTLCDVY